MRQGGVSHTGPLITTVAIVIIACILAWVTPSNANPANPCTKCNSLLWWGSRASYLTWHTMVNDECYYRASLETCNYGKHSLWVAKLKSSGGHQPGPPCPKGQYACFVNAEMWGISDSGGAQDKIKKELRKQWVQTPKSSLKQTQSLPTLSHSFYKTVKGQLKETIAFLLVGENLFIDLMERNRASAKCQQLLDMCRCFNNRAMALEGN